MDEKQSAKHILILQKCYIGDNLLSVQFHDLKGILGSPGVQVSEMILLVLPEQAFSFLLGCGFTCQEKTHEFLPVLFTSSKSSKGIK